ncbi:MAG: bifunctional phosphoribosyl-AMP cyclohydrolase/phosphoribosyl-ATP diphosphatase HisIE [Candidatus Methylomirabilales bacterium]
MNHEQTFGGLWTTRESIVTNLFDELQFDRDGLIPAIAQDAESGQVLMVAFMNREALRETLATGFAHYYSRSRQRLWKKGEESGHVQRVHEIRVDCDADALLLTVAQEGVACHTGNRSCFFRSLDGHGRPLDGMEARPVDPDAVTGPSAAILAAVYRCICDRKRDRPSGSYVVSLLDKGRGQVLKKIGEEATEVVLAAQGGGEREIVYETADLLFHLLVLLADRGIPLEQIWVELGRRVGKQKAEYGKGE